MEAAQKLLFNLGEQYMNYKILHFSDLHLDTTFSGQQFPLEYGKDRRLNLKAALTRIIAHARESNVNAITVAGDLFDQSFLHPETTEFILQQFELVAPIRVIIAPGEHDQFTNESPYSRLNWPENVDIFYQNKLTRIELASGISLWGASNPSSRKNDLLDGYKPFAGINILLLHVHQEQQRWNSSTVSHINIKQGGFDLALLGGEHIGKGEPDENPLIIYPGSPEPLELDSTPGLHSVVLVEIASEGISVKHLPFQTWEYSTVEIDISHFDSDADIARQIESILESKYKSAQIAATINLIGKPSYPLNITNIRQSIQTPIHFRLDTNLDLPFDIDQLINEKTVRGLLVQRMMSSIRNSKNERQKVQLLTALNFALYALDGTQVGLYEIKKN